MQPTDTLMTFRKLKLRKIPYFVDNLTGNMNELEKVFLPPRFLTNASKHISVLLWNSFIIKGQSKTEKSLLATAQEKHRAPLTISVQVENSVHLDTVNEKRAKINYPGNFQFLINFVAKTLLISELCVISKRPG